MKSTIAKKTEGYGYKYTELADINKYCEDNGIRYYQEIETCEINQKDYIITYLITNDNVEKHRGCQIVDAVLQGIKNPVQEYGSSLTYCRRYSLLMALGLATEDDDAASLTQTIEVTQEEADNYRLTFGKHAGKTLKELPKDYIQWMLGNSKDERLIKMIKLATGVETPSEEQLDLLSQISPLIEKTETDREEFYKYYGVKSDAELTIEQLKDAINKLKSKLGE